MKLKQKSEFNITAAENLVSLSLYAPSIHCSYYACFQLMKYALREFEGISYDDIDKVVSTSTFSEHSYIHKKIQDSIYGADKREYAEFKRKLKDLYDFRIRSDYKNEEILLDPANRALRFSKELISYMKENFHV